MDNLDRSLRPKTEMLGEMITPDQNTPPDWLAIVIKWLFLALAGACGTFLSQLHGPHKKWPQRVMEWVGGALCAIYGAELAANTLYHSLDKFDLIDSSYVLPEKILGLAGFLCGALGVSAIDWCITFIRRRQSPK
ncbi:hypothetical protein RAM19_06835 [Bartonella apihabitans]|nr:hypothetical protein [Bartonella apihabitans]WLT07845.1 hypothetical protein RAM19_06835 [Bartonella apihabitans]